MIPVAGIKLGVGRCLCVASDAEQRTEGVERVEAPVEPKREFVEVGLQVPFADPVMDAGQPCLEICEDEMDDGQKLVGHFGITTFGNGVVIVTALAQVGVTAPVVRDDQRPRSDRAIDKSAKGFGASVSGDRQPHAPRIAPIVMSSTS